MQGQSVAPSRPRAWALAITLAAAALGSGAQAQTLAVQDAVSEAAGVHALATAARLCGHLTEADLNRMRMRMDRVHAAQLAERDRETYLILRTSDTFRNLVLTRALAKARNGCNVDLDLAWADVQATLIQADMRTQDLQALSLDPVIGFGSRSQPE